jgi:phage tail-like protein
MPEPAAAPQNAPTAPGAGAQIGTWVDPYRSYNFKLEIQGVTEGHFTECVGLGVRVRSIPYREGGTSQVVHQLPGRAEYSEITLRYGLTTSKLLWDWLMSAVKGKVERRNVSIVIMGDDGVTPVMQWNLINAWVTEWRGAPLDALGQEVAIESVSLVFESIDRA